MQYLSREYYLHRRINERQRLHNRTKKTATRGQIINLALFFGIDPYEYLIDKFYGVGKKSNCLPTVNDVMQWH